MRWAMCQGGADPKWIATVIQTEADAPLIGSVDGIRQTDPALHLKAAAPASVPKVRNAIHQHGSMRE
jgi:hypothetical protein